MKKLLFLIMLYSTIAVGQDKLKVVFFGNSYTAGNNLAKMIQDIALDMGDSLEYDTYTPGGQTLSGHASNFGLFHSRVSQKDYDIVVIQAQSQEPSFSPSQVASQTLPYARQLDSVINSIDACIRTCFFMTWGRENGDQMNCPSYPPLCTYEGMQQRLRESYLLMVQQNNAEVAPVGVAWKTVRDSFPAIQLYEPDESHPSISGSFLAACTFYSTFYNKVVNTQYDPGLGLGITEPLQRIASRAVLDSLELWQIDTASRNMDSVDFSIDYGLGDITIKASDTNLTRYDWKVIWYGVTDTVTYRYRDTSFSLTLPVEGEESQYPEFEVVLEVYESCATISKSIQAHNGWVLGSMNEQVVAPEILNKDGYLIFSRSVELQVLDIQGREVFRLETQTLEADLRYLVRGVYLLRLQDGSQEFFSKIYVE